MTKLFTNVALVKNTMKEARRIVPTVDKVASHIQREIDYAAEHGRGDVIVLTGDFYLNAEDREVITHALQRAGYRHRWRDCNNEDERIHVWWEESND